MVRLNEKFHVAREAHGFVLIEKTVVTEKDTGKQKIGEKKRHTGTVYQALQLFLHQSIDETAGDPQGIRFQVQKAMSEIESAKKEIQREFSLEVCVSRGKNDGR